MATRILSYRENCVFRPSAGTRRGREWSGGGKGEAHTTNRLQGYAGIRVDETSESTTALRIRTLPCLVDTILSHGVDTFRNYLTCSCLYGVGCPTSNG